MAASLWPEDEDRDALAVAWDDAEGGGPAGVVVPAPVVRPKGEPSVTLADFVRGGWHVLEPGTPLVWNWHIDVICEHLTAVADGRITRLVVNIPPGLMKSLLGCVFFPAWVWTWWPEWRALFGSYALDLAIRDSARTRDLIESEWYRDTFRPAWRLSGDRNLKSFFQNTRTGFRLSVAVGSKTTGFRGHATIVDDPLNVADAEARSDVKREAAWRWISKSLSSRLNDQRTGARVFIGQRTHERDPFGYLLERGGYELLRLPSEYQAAHPCATSLGRADRRTRDGELLFPEMFPKSVLDEARTKDLGTYGYAAQHQQQPAPEGGGIFKKDWFQRYSPRTLPPVFEEVLASWDMSFKDAEGSSYVVGQVWGRLGAGVYLLGGYRKKADFPETLRAVLALGSYTAPHEGVWRVPGIADRWHVGPKLVEDKANGPAVISTLRNKVPGLVAIPGNDDKPARARGQSWFVEGRTVYLPETDVSYPSLREPVQAFVDEVTTFPASAYTDQAVAFTQALLRLIPNAESNGTTAASAAPVELSETGRMVQQRF